MGETAILELSVSMLPGLPETVSTWWDHTCKATGLEPKRKHLSLTGYYIIELAKNALACGDEARITVEFFPGCVKVVVEDTGCGFENPLWDIDTSKGGGFGLRRAFQFADRFILETRGFKYEKNGQCLALSGVTNLPRGARITYVKIIKCRP